MKIILIVGLALLFVGCVKREKQEQIPANQGSKRGGENFSEFHKLADLILSEIPQGKNERGNYYITVDSTSEIEWTTYEAYMLGKLMTESERRLFKDLQNRPSRILIDTSKLNLNSKRVLSNLTNDESRITYVFHEFAGTESGDLVMVPISVVYSHGQDPPVLDGGWKELAIFEKKIGGWTVRNRIEMEVY